MNVVLVSYSLLIPYILILVNFLMSNNQATYTLQASQILKQSLLRIEDAQTFIDTDVRRVVDAVKRQQVLHMSQYQEVTALLTALGHIQRELQLLQEALPTAINAVDPGEISNLPANINQELSRIRDSLISLTDISSNSSL